MTTPPGGEKTIDVASVHRVLEAVRPHLQADGGDLEFAGVTPEGIVQVRMLGSCRGCPSSEITLASSIEANLKLHVKGIAGVRIVA